MAFCSTCGAQIADGMTTCAACAGRPAAGFAPVPTTAPAAAPAAASVQSGASGLTDNVAGLLCYSPVGLFADIIFLVAEPYNRNRFIRFHAFQSLFMAVAMVAVVIVLMILGMVLAIIPVVGWIIGLLLWLGFAFGNLALWIMMMIKAYQMQTTKLPFIGDLAAKQAGM
jgi:uncharacterized membrane protein